MQEPIKLQRVLLNDALLVLSDLAGANMTGASLVRCNLSGANLVGTLLADADLTDAVLEAAPILSQSGGATGRVQRTSLVGADLTGAIFDPSSLEDVEI